MTEKPPDTGQNRPAYKCIKTSLKSIAKNDSIIWTLLNTCNMANKIVIHTLQFMKMYFIYLYDKKEKFPIIDTKFSCCRMSYITWSRYSCTG